MEGRGPPQMKAAVAAVPALGPAHGRQRIRQRQTEAVPGVPVRGKDGVVLQGRLKPAPCPVLRRAALVLAIVAPEGPALAPSEGSVVPRTRGASETEPEMEGHKRRRPLGPTPLPPGLRVPPAGPSKARRATGRSIVGPAPFVLRVAVPTSRKPRPASAGVFATLGGVLAGTCATGGSRKVGPTETAVPIKPPLSGPATPRMGPLATPEEEERTAAAAMEGVGVVPAAIQATAALRMVAWVAAARP